MNTKILSVLLLCICSSTFLKAERGNIATNANRFCISLGGGATTLYGDLKQKKRKGAFRADLDYSITPFISAGLEGQYGGLAEGSESIKGGSEGLHMNSKYYSIRANARLGAGQFMSAIEEDTDPIVSILSGIYAGAGIGIINSTVGTIIDTYAITKGPIKGTITKNTSELVIPVNLGINYNIPGTWLALNVNYQYNMTRGEHLDGYDFNVSGNKKNDGYSFLSLAIRYYFGGQ